MTIQRLQDEFTDIPDAQTRYRLRKRAKGLCYSCTNKALEGKTRCADCLLVNKSRKGV